MRAHFPLLPLLVAMTLGCGQGALAPPPGQELTGSPVPTAAPAWGRVRLTSALSGDYDGFRFADKAVITTHLRWVGDIAVPEVRGSDGTILSGDAQRTELQFRSHRYTYLSAPGNALCLLPGPFASLATVDGNECATWSHLQLLSLTGTPTTNSAGKGLVVGTESGAFRMWIVESGWDNTSQTNFVLIDYVADARLMVPGGAAAGASQCALENQACQVRDDCCNSRHSCLSGRCQY